MGDAESRWWHWLVTERQGGLIHQYRDARFEAMRRDPSLRVELTNLSPAVSGPECPCGGNLC